MKTLTKPNSTKSKIQTVSYREYGNCAVTDHIRLQELQCNNGADTIKFDWRTVQAAEAARVFFGKPIIITSAYRTTAYNAAVGGASNSYHVKGQALDTYLSGVEPSLLAKFYQNWGMKGVGCYYDDRFVHVDSRTSTFYWKNQSNTAVSTHLPTLQKGKSGQDVRDLQTLLNRHQVNLSVDGIFGNLTQTAVRNFQQDQSLSVDRIVGKQTWNALLTK